MTAVREDSGVPSFRVLATSGVFEPGFRGGGPIRSVARIADTVSDAIELSLITRDRDLDAKGAYPGLTGQWISRGRSRVFYLDSNNPIAWVRLWRQLAITKFDLLYVNSLWDPRFTIVPILAARLGLIRARGLLIAPRGQLSRGALRFKGRKKSLFLVAWARFLRSMNAAWHASTDKEAADIRAALPWAMVLVNDNQTALPDAPLAPKVSPDRAPRFVFIGRISPKKNLDLTLTAMLRLTDSIEFDIFGPVEDTNYWKRCQALIERLPDQVKATYGGELPAAKVRATFTQYDAFVFPTLGENFGHVIAESLSASCPVLASAETPWTSVLERGGGNVINSLTGDALARELERWARMTYSQRLEARLAAGDAYRVWRGQVSSANVLDQFRLLVTAPQRDAASTAQAK